MSRFALVVFLLSVLFTVTSADVDDGLVGYWSFDEGAGNVAHDSTVHANDGTVMGEATWIDGVSGHALLFDGVDDYVQVGDEPELNITGDITITCWFKTNAAQSGTLVSKYDNTQTDEGYILRVGDQAWGVAGTLSFRLASDSQNLENQDAFTTSSEFTDEKWYFAAAIYQPDGSNRPRIYIDGVEQSGQQSGEHKSSIGASPGFDFRIGAYSLPAVDPGFKFTGAIDEVRVYDRVLTDEEITALYLEGVPCDGSPESQGFWHRQCLGVPASGGGIDPGRHGRGPSEPTEPGFEEELMPCADDVLEDQGFYGTATCEGLNADPADDTCEKALKQYTSLVLNVCSNRLHQGCEVDLSAEGCNSATVGELTSEIAALIQVGACQQAASCAGAVNRGEGLTDTGLGGSSSTVRPRSRERHPASVERDAEHDRRSIRKGERRRPAK